MRPTVTTTFGRTVNLCYGSVKEITTQNIVRQPSHIHIPNSQPFYVLRMLFVSTGTWVQFRLNQEVNRIRLLC